MSVSDLVVNSSSQSASIVSGTVFAIIVVAIFWTRLQQVLFKDPNEPPVVSYWLPVIGSTVTYGIDPFKFFFDCQAKVC